MGNYSLLSKDKRLGSSKTPEENNGLIEQFINRMEYLIDNRNQQGKLLKELIESIQYNFIEFCEPDDQFKFKRRLENLIKKV